jgi:hypothetical protein
MLQLVGAKGKLGESSTKRLLEIRKLVRILAPENPAYQALFNSVPLKTDPHSNFHIGGQRWLNQLKP